MNTTIFSRNRGAQLDLMLRSLEKFFPDALPATVVCRYDIDFLKGLNKARKLHPRVVFLSDNQMFKSVVLGTLLPEEPLSVFFCDDDVLIRPVRIKDQEFSLFSMSDGAITLSLRMDPKYEYCYDADTPNPPPDSLSFTKEGIVPTWKWKGLSLDWGYPMTVSGHVFKTDAIVSLLERGDFNNPNSMESYMASHPIDGEWMMCYPEARVVHTPLNKVQTVAPRNRSASIDPMELERKFVKGKRLSLDAVVSTDFKSCMQVVEPVWK